MNDVISFLRNYDYENCFAKGSNWSLEEAVDYIAAYQANSESWSGTEEAYQGFVSIRGCISTAVQRGIDEGGLAINEVYKESGNDEADISCSGIDFKKSTVVPIIFINWAINNNIKVPKEYEEYAATNKKNKSVYYQGLGIKKSCIHHERSRAVAELLWSIEPEMTIAEMARRTEIYQFGCEGHKYDTRTISRWLASLKADRRPGRPRN